ncbi:hypothetical protein MUK42_06135 [Musa troglodytarum]|uniref:Rhodanese domain-containing protein n=1 Tax=Musa troglodytarum TaxID=320322 RepID=A0A9E7L0Y9_9LILI|nr:hypothetical protein MUK42_06135 [Musa troglodytarum]
MLEKSKMKSDFMRMNIYRINIPKMSSEKLNLIPESSRITSKEYNEIVNAGEPHILVDVRPVHHFKIAAIPKSMNIPLSNLEDKLSTIDSALKQAAQDSGKCASLFVVCRRGNDSQRAVDYLSKNDKNNSYEKVGLDPARFFVKIGGVESDSSLCTMDLGRLRSPSYVK